MTTETLKQPRYAWLDYGRFFSALAVVLFHYLANGPRSENVGSDVKWPHAVSAIACYGYLGVDFFFVVSGFVIFFSAMNRSAGGFAASRFVRLWPAFIVCMTITAITTTALSFQNISMPQYFANLTMVPMAIGYESVDGVYWTLLLEIAFYFVIFLAISTRLINFPLPLVAIGTIGVACYFASGLTIPFANYAPLFTAGCALALIYRGERRVLMAYLCFALSGSLAVFSGFRFAVHQSTKFPELLPWVAALIVAVFLLSFLWFRERDVVDTGKARLIGSLTYPLYLLHAYIGYAILSAIQAPKNQWWITPLLIVAMVLCAWLVTEFVEQRPQGLWKRLAARFIAKPIDRLLSRRGPRLLECRKHSVF